MVDELDYPVLFGTTQATWAPIDLRFELLTGEVDPGRVARVYVVPFVGDGCVVVGFQHGDWGPAGGGLCLYGYGDVELVGAPRLRDGAERTIAVEVMPPAAAASLLAGKGRSWEAELYRLAAARRTVDSSPP